MSSSNAQGYAQSCPIVSWKIWKFLTMVMLRSFEKILGRLRKMTLGNLSRQHQRILDTFFVSVS